MMKLVKPSMEYAKTYAKAIDEYNANRSPLATMDWLDYINEYGIEAFIEKKKRYDKGDVPEGKVPATMFWLIENDIFIGQIDIRHKLNDRLKKLGGHIGYAIRPSKQKQGYGTKMLKMGLVEAKKLGIDRAFITCDDDNIASQKIIESNGGVLEKKAPYKDTLRRYYWIEIN